MDKEEIQNKLLANEKEIYECRCKIIKLAPARYEGSPLDNKAVSQSWDLRMQIQKLETQRGELENQRYPYKEVAADTTYKYPYKTMPKLV